MRFNNLKLRISLTYSFLLMLILGTTLIASYKIIGLQLKNEIVDDLKSKAEMVNFFLTQDDVIKEKSEGEHHNEGGEGSENGHRYEFRDIQLFTEGSDKNIVLLVYSEGQLKYMTESYKNSYLVTSPVDIPDGEVIDIDYSGIPFCLTAIDMSEFKVYIGYKVSELEELQNKLMNIFLLIFPIGVILSFIFGYLVTQRSMNIVQIISETAQFITSQNLNKRIDEPKSKDEITTLIITLNSMIDRLEKSFNQATQFSQDAAHEIRTPLTIIRGEIEELIESNILDNNTSKTLENTLEEIQYLTSISERLLLIHKMDTNNIKYHFEPVDLSALMVEIAQDAEIISANKSIEISLQNSKDVIFRGNKELITRLLWNITDNAIKYNKPSGSISYELRKELNNILIIIKDSGIGIPADDIPKIFDRFYRVDKSRSRRLGGSGLGLSICSWIAELHDGKIQVESKVDIGTEFTIILPG